MSRTVTVATIAVLLLASACRWSDDRRLGNVPSPLLAPFRPGMDLRESYETLPDAGAEHAAHRLFTDNREAWVERWRLLDSATTSIDVSYFILHEDVFGLSFLGHLLERARAGVTVRILLDAFGTKMSRELLDNGFLEELAAMPNVELKTYRPLWRRWVEGLLTLRPSAIIASEHDKIIVVDDRRSLIGGRNIGVEYFADPEDEGTAFRDMDLRIDSAAVATALTRAFESQLETEDAVSTVEPGQTDRSPELLRVFEAMDAWLHDRPWRPLEIDAGAAWVEQLQSRFDLRGTLEEPSAEPFRAETRILDSQARYRAPDDPISEALGRFVRSAREEIFAQSPYLVLSEEGLRLLEDAAARGVRITVVTNSPVSSDNALSQAFFLEQWPEILARVPTMRLFVAGDENNLHAKAVTFDGQLAMVGTYNLDPVSMAFNSEVMAAVWSKEFADVVDRQAREAVEQGAPRIFEYRIERTSDGRPLRDEDGRIRIAFGPEDHCTPQQWTSLNAYWTLLQAAREFTGFSPIL